MSTRRSFLILMGTAALLSAGLVQAREPGTIPRIGFLATTNPQGTPHYQAFLQGLQELGYTEGRNIQILHRWSDGVDRQPALAADLLNHKVDLIVAWSTPSAVAAKKATATVPIVMIAVSDPVGSGIVESLSRPGGNVTGMSNMHRGTITKNLEMLAKLNPAAKRIAVLRNPENPAHGLVLEEAETAAQVLGLRLAIADVLQSSDLESAFATIRKEQVAGLVIFGDPAFVGQRQRIAELALKASLPSTTIFRQYPEAGGLMSYGLNTTDLFRRAANFVDKILKGAKPADLPVELPTTFEMVVNHKTAKALGLVFPESMLLRADKVIE